MSQASTSTKMQDTHLKKDAQTFTLNFGSVSNTPTKTHCFRWRMANGLAIVTATAEGTTEKGGRFF